jgi:hypothetical protein
MGVSVLFTWAWCRTPQGPNSLFDYTTSTIGPSGKQLEWNRQKPANSLQACVAAIVEAERIFCAPTARDFWVPPSSLPVWVPLSLSDNSERLVSSAPEGRSYASSRRRKPPELRQTQQSLGEAKATSPMAAALSPLRGLIFQVIVPEAYASGYSLQNAPTGQKRLAAIAGQPQGYPYGQA